MAAAPGKLKLAVDRLRFRMEEEHYPTSRVYLTASRFGAWRPVHDWHVYIANVGQFGCFPRVFPNYIRCRPDRNLRRANHDEAITSAHGRFIST
jgi:hypothetical protein